MMKYYVYALIDPRYPNRYYYIGCSTNLKNRMSNHTGTSHVHAIRRWSQELKQIGLVPSFIILESFTNRERALEAENEWINNSKSEYLINTQLTLRQVSTGKPANGKLRAVDKVVMDTILNMLKENHGNKLATAKALGIGRQTLYNKLHRWQSLGEPKSVEPISTPTPCPDTPTH